MSSWLYMRQLEISMRGLLISPIRMKRALQAIDQSNQKDKKKHNLTETKLLFTLAPPFGGLTDLISLAFPVLDLIENERRHFR